MIHYLQIKDGIVINRVIAEEPLPPEWFGEGETWEQNDTADIGWSFDGKEFAPPLREPEPTPEAQADPRDEKIAALEARLAKLEEAEDSRKTLTVRN